jgi:hypothetical protein
MFTLLLPLFLPSSLLLVPKQDLFYLPVLHFFKCILIVQRDLPWYLYCNQIKPLYYLLFLYCSATRLFNSFQCISLYYLHTQIQCISILFSLYYSQCSDFYI